MLYVASLNSEAPKKTIYKLNVSDGSRFADPLGYPIYPLVLCLFEIFRVFAKSSMDSSIFIHIQIGNSLFSLKAAERKRGFPSERRNVNILNRD